MKYLFTKTLVCIALACCALQSLDAQSLKLSNVNTSGYPTIRATYVAMDNAGRILRDLSASDFRVTERFSNNKTIDVSSSVTQGCTPSDEDAPVSLMIVLDLSTSMSFPPRNSATARIDIAKAALQHLFSTLNYVPGTRVCIIGFAAQSSLICPWTNSSATLISSLDNALLQIMTNYEEPFFGDPNIFDEFAKCDPTIAKVTIFISDGHPNPDIGNTYRYITDVSTKAKEQEIVIHSVSIDLEKTYEPLDSICKRSGGTSSVGPSTNLAEMIEAARVASSKGEACHIEWISPNACGPTDALRTAVVTLLRQGEPKDSVQYTAPQTISVLPTEFASLPTVSQNAPVVAQFNIRPPAQFYGDITRLAFELDYPQHILNYVSARSTNGAASIVSDANSTPGKLRYEVAVAPPFTTELRFDIEFWTLLAADTIANLTARITTDYDCVQRNPVSGQILVTRSCAGSRRVVNLGTHAFGLSSVYPNPASDKMSVRYSTGYNAASTLEIVDAMGNVVHSVSSPVEPPAEYEMEVPVADLQQGAYILRFTSGHYVESKFITVVH